MPANNTVNTIAKKDGKKRKSPRKLKLLDPKIIKEIIYDESRTALVRYVNPLFGRLNKTPCSQSHCNVCPLTKVDYEPPIEDETSENTSLTALHFFPSFLCTNCLYNKVRACLSFAARWNRLPKYKKRKRKAREPK